MNMNYFNYQFMYFQNAIPPQICDLIIERGTKKIQKSDEKDTIATTGNSAQKSKKRTKAVEHLKDADDPSKSYIRDTTVTWLNQDWMYHLIIPYIDKANQEAGWGFEYASHEHIQFGQYMPPRKKDETGQFYGWHEDTLYNPETDDVRKISTIVALSDPNDYTDGELMLDMGEYAEERYINAKEIMPKGTILVFPSTTYHMVKPVTRGERYSLVLWTRGPRFK